MEEANRESPTMARGQLRPVTKNVVWPGEWPQVKRVFTASSPMWKWAFSAKVLARGWATVEDLNDAYQVTLFIGDIPGTPFDDPSAHGDGEQRKTAFTTGLEDGLLGCNFLPDPGT